MIERIRGREKAILVGICHKEQSKEQLKEYLDELTMLCYTAGAEPVKIFTQNIHHKDPAYLIGSGKVQEIAKYIDENKDIALVIFDDELSPSQQRNLEKETKRKILDRTGLILDIFADRAQTAYAKTQVELAQYEYLLPRLTGMWTHLEKQRGGIGMRGPGESEIETDRRRIRKRIALLKERLVNVDRQMTTQRRNRGQLIRVSIVGYTNAGKSTLMNLVSHSDVLAENALFATLDTTVRKVTFDNTAFLLSDTVGFIRKLPTFLIEAFKSTLDEVREADMLLHVVDVSHPSFEDHIQVVKQTLTGLKCIDKPMLTVFNKVDMYRIQNEEGESVPLTIEGFKNSFIAKTHSPCVFISAGTKTNIEEFRNTLLAEVKKQYSVRYPYMVV
ncbi:MAG TPA: GTPase HflX [Bacteroidia bacterium]|jgi:GTP-binding protein HflX|nr:GTPase HflX [Bacteroidia bacterium]